jgi:hypothetical protein
VLAPDVDGDAVRAEFEVCQRVAGEDVITDDTDRDGETLEFGRFDFGATGVVRRGGDRRVDERVTELVVATVRARSAAQASTATGRLDADERTRPRVERVAHAPGLLSLALEDVSLDGFASEFYRAGSVVVRKADRLRL